MRNPQAFNVTGVDFAGPLFYKPAPPKRKGKKAVELPAESRSLEETLPLEESPPVDVEEEPITTKTIHAKHLKSYICLFTCAVTRAVHLELTPDMTARSFMLALRRFAARRGPISVMYSDNAQTFRCVNQHINFLHANEQSTNLLANHRMEWVFSASLAPWWGGFWERMVRSVKDLLRRSNGRACLQYDELEVSLIEIESFINARPLTYVGEGADDPLPITPNQFLNNRRSTCAEPEPAINLVAPTSTDQELARMGQERRNYVKQLCSRFVSDYLLEITNFHCKGRPGKRIRIGEIVVIHDETAKRIMWSTGVVTELIPSRDGLVRSAMVRKPNGNIINRAIQFLYPLELRQESEEDMI